ncbi:AAA family ATPase [archaeon]|jgi:thymidylate kinase|nr:AAA family ATPase [archaeon]MBT6955843.1 AAA family ATPase [archaeon]MBT7128281.1 AAA family ATPase [archaeon]
MVLIIFEGLPGAGKTTLIHQLSKELSLPTIEEVLDQNSGSLLPGDTRGFSENFFFNSDRLKYSNAKRVGEKIVLIDRGVFSTWAYNSCLNNKDILEKAKNNANLILKKYNYDCIYVYIKIDTKTSLVRKKKKINDSFDMWSFKKNLEKTKEFYDNKFKDIDNVIIIDGLRNYNAVLKELKVILLEKFT